MAQASHVYGGDEINAAVFDPGAAWTRVGWSAEDGPSITYSSNYAYRDGQAKFGDENTYLLRPNTEIRNPMEDSVVNDWDVATNLWKAALSEASPTRDTQYLTESPILMTEPFWNSRESQKKAMEFALNDLQSPAFFIAKSPVLALFAAGRGSGIVIDAGAQTISVTPVIDGVCLYKPSRRSRRAGNFLNQQIKEYLKEDVIPQYEIRNRTPVGPDEAPNFEKREDLPEGITESYRSFQVSRVLEQFKESVVQVSDSVYSSSSNGTYKSRIFEFPDGHQIQLSGDRYFLGERLFETAAGGDSDPSAMEVDSEAPAGKASGSKDDKKGTSTSEKPGEDPVLPAWSAKGASQMVIDCLKACDVDVRANLANNIVVTGGTSLLQGFTERINQDLQKEFPMLKIRIFAPGNIVERKNGAWIGGSILSSLGTFHQLWVSKQEYEEIGPEQLVYKRFR